MTLTSRPPTTRLLLIAPMLLVGFTIAVMELASSEPLESLNVNCQRWDAAATRAMASYTGVSQHQIEDAHFRLLRARRNCAAGWLNIACGDYQMLTAGPLPAGDRKRYRIKVSKICGLAIADR